MYTYIYKSSLGAGGALESRISFYDLGFRLQSTGLSFLQFTQLWLTVTAGTEIAATAISAPADAPPPRRC